MPHAWISTSTSKSSNGLGLNWSLSLDLEVRYLHAVLTSRLMNLGGHESAASTWNPVNVFGYTILTITCLGRVVNVEDFILTDLLYMEALFVNCLLIGRSQEISSHVLGIVCSSTPRYPPRSTNLAESTIRVASIQRVRLHIPSVPASWSLGSQRFAEKSVHLFWELIHYSAEKLWAPLAPPPRGDSPDSN